MEAIDLVRDRDVKLNGLRSHTIRPASSRRSDGSSEATIAGRGWRAIPGTCRPRLDLQRIQHDREGTRLPDVRRVDVQLDAVTVGVADVERRGDLVIGGQF